MMHLGRFERSHRGKNTSPLEKRCRGGTNLLNTANYLTCFVGSEKGSKHQKKNLRCTAEGGLKKGGGAKREGRELPIEPKKTNGWGAPNRSVPRISYGG